MLAMHRSMAITAMIVPLISCWCVIVGAADELAAPWTRGESAALTVQPDGAMILLRRHTAATSSWWSGGAALLTSAVALLHLKLPRYMLPQ